MDEVDEIVRALGPEQREGVLTFPDGKANGDEIGVGHGLAMFMLIYRGLIAFRKRWWLFGEPVFYLTRLGRRVRDRLLNRGMRNERARICRRCLSACRPRHHCCDSLDYRGQHLRGNKRRIPPSRHPCALGEAKIPS